MRFVVRYWLIVAALVVGFGLGWGSVGITQAASVAGLQVPGASTAPELIFGHAQQETDAADTSASAPINMTPIIYLGLCVLLAAIGALIIAYRARDKRM